MMTNERNMFEYIGDEDQLLSLRESRLTGGFAEGVRAMEVHNGGNLSVCVFPDRGMDIYQVRYMGKNISYIAPCGVRGPQYYDAHDAQWLRNFFTGFLTTCGLRNIGNPGSVNGEEIGLHGRISNTPAENVKYTRDIIDGVPALTLEGTMREARLFGENLRLNRKLAFEYDKDSFTLTDTITNHGYNKTQFVYALHLNYGYPLLEEGAELIIDSESPRPRNDEAARHLDTWRKIEAPANPYPERCYIHNPKKAADGTTGYTLFNRQRGIGIKVEYNGDALPHFCQWKMLGKGEYVMGLEPMNASLDAPKIGQPGCEAPALAPGESLVYKVNFTFIDRLD